MNKEKKQNRWFVSNWKNQNSILLEETLQQKKIFGVSIDERKLEGSIKTNNHALLVVITDDNMHDGLSL